MATIANRLQEYLKLLNTGQPNAADKDFDPEYEQGVRENTNQLTQLANRFDTQGNEDQIEQTRSMGLLNESRDENIGNLKETLADRGILRSGATLTGTADIGKQHTRSVDELSREISGRAKTREQDFSDQQTNFQSAIERLKLDKARRQAEKEEERVRRESEIASREQGLRQQQEATAKAEQERVAAEQAEAQKLQAAQPQLQGTGEYAPPQNAGGFNIPPEWRAAIENDPKLAMIYGIPYRPSR